MKKNILLCAIVPSAALFLLTFCLFQFLYQFDNKYTMVPAYGKAGIFSFSEADLGRPLFLIDGWELYPDVRLTPADFAAGRVPPHRETFIGQYSNFSYLLSGHSPFGSATYRLTLRYDGAPRALLLTLPEIFSDYTLWANGVLVAQTGDGPSVILHLDGETALILSTENHTHYYSGLYYPPALGTPAVIGTMSLTQNLFYGVLCAFSMALCLFVAVGWKRGSGDPVFFHFGLLCLFFALHCAYPFLRQIGLNSPVWYAVEDASWLLVLYETIMLCTWEAGLTQRKWFRWGLRPLALAACAGCFFCVALLIPAMPAAVSVYGKLIDLSRLLCWLYLLLCAVWGLREKRPSGGFLLAAGGVLGAAQLVNLVDNNHFEPIYTGWQTEYAGFLLVLVFWAMILRHVRTLRVRNEQLTEHLEDLVQQRTAELHAVLRERKSFFSDMAHNLKAPVAAIHGFISLILQENLYLDDELREHLTQISSENAELQRRMEALSGLNAFDKLTEPSEVIAVDDLLRQVQSDNEPETCISGVHLVVKRLGVPACVTVQRKRLLLLFENLIYNALAFTPEDGAITITPSLEKDAVVIQVTDTGSGIAPEHLPYIFDRFYSVREHKNEGSGLGLYIARLTVEELGGSISVRSELGQGTTFTVSLPCISLL